MSFPVRNKALSHSAADLLADIRYEVMPTKTIEQAVVEWVPTSIPITITASPSKGIDTTMDLAGRLVRHGYRVVPHLSARLVRDEIHLKYLVQQALDLGVDDVFVPAGDADPPAGKYHGAVPLLAELTAMDRPFAHVGITGYPESHPLIDDDITIQSMWDKREHGTYIVSNLCFDAATLNRWVRRVRARGITLPIRIGLAGPVDPTKLLSMATKVGVGDSTKFLTRHASWFMRLTAPGGYSPERMLQRIGPTMASPQAAVPGLHVFTFNQVAKTEQWRQRLLATVKPA
jgi:methylenetetrahydrofolate reductase (NADH)